MKTRYHSYKKGSLPKGCQLCVRGLKSVLFITGICAKGCFYCPISEEKHQKDVIYINERKAKGLKDVLEEIQISGSSGAGITGGDPLARIDRTTRYIRALKKHFGQNFHIHLYTPMALIDEKKLERLFQAGLDEIRFHPDTDKPKEWGRIDLARRWPWQVGIEIPAIPGRYEETKHLLKALDVDFINVNELEVSDTNANRLIEKGYRTKDRLSYAVKGSQALAIRLLKDAKRMHYCTSKLKDAVQLRNRLKRRAANARADYDIVTDEGLLVRGAIYGMPPRKTGSFLKGQGVDPGLIREEKNRTLTAASIVEELADELKGLGAKPAIVEEYPTYDQMNVITLFL